MSTVNLNIEDLGTNKYKYLEYETRASKELKPGHVIRLMPGMKVPADCILIYVGNSHQPICKETVEKLSSSDSLLKFSKTDIMLVSESEITGDDRY